MGMSAIPATGNRHARRSMNDYVCALTRSVVAAAVLSLSWLPGAPPASASTGAVAAAPSGTGVDGTYDLYGIACEPGTGTCIAVGDGLAAGHTLAVVVVVSITNGVAGKPLPVFAADTLRSVACPSVVPERDQMRGGRRKPRHN